MNAQYDAMEAYMAFDLDTYDAKMAEVKKLSATAYADCLVNIPEMTEWSKKWEELMARSDWDSNKIFEENKDVI